MTLKFVVALRVYLCVQMLELLVEKCVLCCEGGVGSLSPGSALRRIFECIASGMLLTGKTA